MSGRELRLRRITSSLSPNVREDERHAVQLSIAAWCVVDAKTSGELNQPARASVRFVRQFQETVRLAPSG